MTPGSESPKEEWRRWARQTRDGIDMAGRSAAVVAGLRRWGPLVTSSATLVYLPLGDEIDLRSLTEDGPGGVFYATHTPDRGGQLTVHKLEPPLEVHRLGFLQPHAAAPRIDPSELDVLLVPGLAFDLWGTRLGRGAGYFDRLLADVSPDAAVVGVTVPELVVDRLPREAHDVPVGFLATDEGVVEVTGSES